MAAKYAIALREVREARYWLNLLAEEPTLKTQASKARPAAEIAHGLLRQWLFVAARCRKSTRQAIMKSSSAADAE